MCAALQTTSNLTSLSSLPFPIKIQTMPPFSIISTRSPSCLPKPTNPVPTPLQHLPLHFSKPQHPHNLPLNRPFLEHQQLKVSSVSHVLGNSGLISVYINLHSSPQNGKFYAHSSPQPNCWNSERWATLHSRLPSKRLSFRQGLEGFPPPLIECYVIPPESKNLHHRQQMINEKITDADLLYIPPALSSKQANHSPRNPFPFPGLFYICTYANPHISKPKTKLIIIPPPGFA